MFGKRNFDQDFSSDSVYEDAGQCFQSFNKFQKLVCSGDNECAAGPSTSVHNLPHDLMTFNKQPFRFGRSSLGKYKQAYRTGRDESGRGCNLEHGRGNWIGSRNLDRGMQVSAEKGRHNTSAFLDYGNELDAFEQGPARYANYLKNKPKYPNSSREGNVYTLAEYIKKMPKKENDIQNFEIAMSGSKINVRPQYTCEMLLFYGNDSMFTGALHLNDVFLARGVGKNKKDTKHETYRIAYEVLTRKTVEDIVRRVDPGVDMVRIELLQTFGEETTGCLSGECTPMQAALAAELEKVQNNIDCYGTLSENSISAIELQLKRPGIQIKSTFNVEVVNVEKGHYFIGELKFNDILITTGEGMSKKMAKTATYMKALEYLQTKTPRALARGGGLNAHIKAPMQTKKPDAELTFENTKILSDTNSVNLTSQLNAVISKVKASEMPENYTCVLDNYLIQSRLCTVVLIKSLPKDKQPIKVIHDPKNVNFNGPCIATLHVNCIVVAEETGSNKNEAQELCYQKAWEVFSHKSVSELHHRFPHHDPVEDTSATIIDIIIKGKGKFGDSNLERLIKMNMDVFQNWRPICDLIILESPELVANRRRNAFLILCHSATVSGMLLEWTFDRRVTSKGTGASGCFIRLQREVIGQYVSLSKTVARNEACLDILRKYYFSQTVIQKLPLTDEDIKYSVSWTQLHEEVALWKPDPVELAENMAKVDCSIAYTKEFRESALFQYVLNLSKVAEEKLVGSFVLGYDFPDEFKKMLYVLLDRKGWRLESKKTPGGSYTFIHRQRDTQEIAALLEENRSRIVSQHRLVDPTTITDCW